MQKINILRKNWEFQDIIEEKNQVVSNYLIFYYRKSKNNLRAGISISKKFANAVKRNKYKRQVRSALDLIKPWNYKYDLIIILRKPFLNLNFDEKIKQLRKNFERL